MIAIILMVTHAGWALVALLREDEKTITRFHTFSIFGWAVWLIPFFSPMFFALAVWLAAPLGWLRSERSERLETPEATPHTSSRGFETDAARPPQPAGGRSPGFETALRASSTSRGKVTRLRDGRCVASSINGRKAAGAGRLRQAEPADTVP
jgi:hypothetical protein